MAQLNYKGFILTTMPVNKSLFGQAMTPSNNWFACERKKISNGKLYDASVGETEEEAIKRCKQVIDGSPLIIFL